MNNFGRRLEVAAPLTAIYAIGDDSTKFWTAYPGEEIAGVCIMQVSGLIVPQILRRNSMLACRISLNRLDGTAIIMLDIPNQLIFGMPRVFEVNL